jgi:hypothetical protein
MDHVSAVGLHGVRRVWHKRCEVRLRHLLRPIIDVADIGRRIGRKEAFGDEAGTSG